MEEIPVNTDEPIKSESFEEFLNRVGKKAEANRLTEEILNKLLSEE